MKSVLRRLPSPPMVVACIALAVALGGTSYAAIRLPRNSVGTAQLQNDAVTARKLATRSVGPRKLQNNAVGDPNVKSNSLTGAKINESTLAQVPSAAKAADSTTVAGYTVRRFVTTVAPGGAEATVLNLNGLVITLTCPGGSVAIRANNNSGEAAQLQFEGRGSAAFGGGSGNFLPTSNVNLNNSENRGTGTAQYVRGSGSGVTASYGWREDALGTTAACRVFGQAVSG
ncbi:MAG: hypothetical protein ABI896_06440 [Actinomycetota bacterium]